jgi:hypothetical protein
VATITTASPPVAESGVTRKTHILPRALFLAICMAIAAAGRVGFLAHPFVNDSGLYIYMGKVTAEGGQLYRDFYETKFPGVGLLAAGCWKLCGTNWAAYIALSFILGLAAPALLGWTVMRWVGRQAGWAAFMYAIVLFNFAPAVFGGFQLETMQACFEIIAAAAGLELLGTGKRRWALAAGVAAGCAAMIKPTGVAVLGALAIAAMVEARHRGPRRLLRSAPMALAGLAIPVALVGLYTWRSGIAGEMPEVFRQIRLYGSQTPLSLQALWTTLFAAAVLGFPMFVRWRGRRAQRDVDTPSRAVVVFALSWLALEAAGVAAQGRFYQYHFLVLAPPAAMVYALIPRPARMIPAMLGLLPVTFLSVTWNWPDLLALDRGVPRLAVSDYLAAHANPGDAFWSHQMPRILLETGLRPGARYMHLFYFANYDSAPLDYVTILLADFDERKPKYIMLDRDLDGMLQRQINDIPMLTQRPLRKANFLAAWAELRSYVKKHYVEQTEIDSQVIYRRK